MNGLFLLAALFAIIAFGFTEKREWSLFMGLWGISMIAGFTVELLT